MFFRTGEFARMLSVEKSVLIYYDRIGLFCPVDVDGNGYRCYSAEQTRDFHFIRLLRDLGLSLDEIAAALSARDAASLEALFRARASALDREIARLTALRSRLSASVEDLEHIQLSPPEIVFLPEKRFAAIDLSPEQFRDKKLRQRRIQELMSAVDQSGFRNLFKGTMVPLASLLDGSFRRGCFCIELTDDSANPLLRIRPAGSYTRTVCSCSYAALADRYAELLRFLRSQGFSPCGDGMDRELAGPYGEEGSYLLEITIPVHSRA